MYCEKVYFLCQEKKVGGYIYKPHKDDINLPTVIIVHGFGSGTISYRANFMKDQLVQQGFLVYMFDFYDKPSGLSDFPIKEMLISLQLQILNGVVDFLCLRDDVDSSRIGLTGHSLGGMTCYLYVSQDDRIKSLVIQASVSKFGETGLSKPDPIWEKEVYKTFERSWGSFEVNHKFIIEGRLFDVYKEIGKISCPTLILHGDKDQLVPLEQAKEQLGYFKKGVAELDIIYGADHSFYCQGEDELITLKEATRKLVDFFKKQL